MAHPSPNFHSAPAEGCLAFDVGFSLRQGHIHGGPSVESGFIVPDLFLKPKFYHYNSPYLSLTDEVTPSRGVVWLRAEQTQTICLTPINKHAPLHSVINESVNPISVMASKNSDSSFIHTGLE
ncbi:hypothetical protein AVEN_161441-1 [Araneus ventricosus]|nr:hypothetical protein AVEN_83558-1 [Araneus ventricosus]GBO31756.1 hypothetical protein AVEN_161441-1 [Araneus ventricosus]